MAITAADIKLLASERMTDTTDGGGRRTSNVIPDGVAGNIFPKVSRLDGVYGRVNLRKVFAHVDTATIDTYAGAHAAIIDAADNDKIKVNLFTTNSDFDDRTAARDRIESYVIAGPESRMVLYGRQLYGQQAITVVQRIEDTLPEIGEVICLSNEIAGVVSAQQFVRIEDVSHEPRTFTDTNGDFTRRVISLKLSAALRYEFVGWETISRFSSTARTALVRATNVADAARYFGISSQVGSAVAGALTLSLDSIYSNLVPTNQREAAVSNAQIIGAVSVRQVGDTRLAYRKVGTSLPNTGGFINTTDTFNLGSPVAPGTLLFYVSEDINTNKTVPVADDGKGVIPQGLAGSGTGYQVLGGTVDYASGVCTVTWRYGNGSYGGNLYCAYIPAVELTQPAHLIEQPVTLQTRGTVHVFSLNPLPAKGTAFVDFRALGKWYRLRDDGTGKLVGTDAAYGTGTLDFVTGSLVVTLGALPDVGSSVIVGWGSPAHYTSRAGATSDAETFVRQKFVVGSLPVKPGTLSVKYTAGITEYTATADVAGVVTGGGVTGTVNHTTGEVEIRYTTRLPNVGGGLTISYQQEVPTVVSAPTSQSGTGVIASFSSPTFNTAANVASKGLRLFVPITLPAANGQLPVTALIAANDDGLGNIVTLPGTGVAQEQGYSHAGGVTVGTVAYATGVVTINPAAVLPVQRQVWVTVLNGGGSWTTQTINLTPITGDYAWVLRLTNASTGTVVNVALTQTAAPLTLDLLATQGDAIVPGSVGFTAFGKTYFDRNGILFHTLAADGTGTQAGTVNYATGVVTITGYTNDTAMGLTVGSVLSKLGNFNAAQAVFRTAGSPLRPASTLVQVTAADGTLLTATCDQSGTIVGSFTRGKVNQQFGLVSIEWGEMVTAAGNETQPWYDPAKVVGSQVWKPRAVMPETIRYSTVVLSSLPVDANILGLDPVRLPSDGRVPIFRAGDVVLVHNTKTFVLPNPAVAGATYNMGRTDLRDLVLLDAVGTKVPATQYADDLALGTLTMAANMNLGTLVQPLRARHRIEELNLTTDVQINGQITLASPLSRAFDVDTKVSSCLLFGDMFARVSNIFDQETWTNAWSDVRIGNNATPEFNNALFPITVTNRGGITERWRIAFTGATAFQVIGEHLGVIGTGTTAADYSPVNPLTGTAYFTIPAGSWGLGWAVGNQLRFNTYGATGPIWLARTVLPGAILAGDSIDIQVRGDVDA